MPILHIFLALIVSTIWGINFIFIKISLTEVSPLLLCALRFLLASFPAIFLVKKPIIPAKILISYGLIMFALQFIFLFLGMHLGMTPGMAGLIMQVQMFFTMIFAAILLKEIPSVEQLVGALVSFLGIGMVATHFDQNISILGFLCILGAAATWGIGNLITKKHPVNNMMSLIVWGSFIAAIPLVILSLVIDGPHNIITSIQGMSLKGMMAIAYIVCMSTWLAYGIWSWLISRHPVGEVVPFTLLVPIVGLLSSVIVFSEPLQSWKLMAGFLVISGLCISRLQLRLLRIPRPKQTINDAA